MTFPPQYKEARTQSAGGNRRKNIFRRQRLLYTQYAGFVKEVKQYSTLRIFMRIVRSRSRYSKGGEGEALGGNANGFSHRDGNSRN